MSDAANGDRRVLRVVRGGEPTPEELAALVAVIVTRSRAPRAEAGTPRSAWADRAAALRSPVRVGPGAWRTSGRSPGTRTRAGW